MGKSGLLRRLAVAACLLFASHAVAQTPDRAKARHAITQAERVADWQLASLEEQAKSPHGLSAPTGWVHGALWVGMTTLADHSRNPKYAEAVYAHGLHNYWNLESRTFHADDYVIGQTWLWAYEHRKDPHMIAPLRERFDIILAANPTNGFDFGLPKADRLESGCQYRWCWSDALFMAPPAWAEMSRATGDPRYLAYGDKEFWAATDVLFDKEEGLYYRDTRFFTRKGDYGEKVFWSRGNGWSYAGIVRVMTLLPKNHPSRPRYEALFKQMSATLVRIQKADGYWPGSLLQPHEGTPPETSGTGFFTYGLAYGVRTGLLRGPRYREAAERGWAALNKAVHPDGKLGWVQPIGAAPAAVSYDDTQLFGVGAYLLAATEMADLYADTAAR